MKKLSFIFVALFTVLTSMSFVSCNNDDKDEPESNSIIGKWNCYKVVENGKSYDRNIDVDFKKDQSFSFNLNDGSGVMTGFYVATEAGSYTLKFDGSYAPGNITGTYSINGDEMTAQYNWDTKGTAYLKRVK